MEAAVDQAIARPYRVPQSGGRGAAIALALVMHALLGVLLFFGIRWQSSPPESIEAELWSPTVQTAAPKPMSVPPPPKVEAPRPEPKVVEPPKPEPKADIAERTKVEPPKKKPEPKVEPPKPQPKVQPAPPKVEAKVKPEPAKIPPPVAAPSDLKNLLASANEGATSERGGTGRDQQTSGPRGRDTWKGRLQNAIRSQMRYPQSCPSSTTVSMRIALLPNGEVADVSIEKPSVSNSFDQAVERAVRAASPLPRDEQGRIPERNLLLDYKLCETT